MADLRYNDFLLLMLLLMMTRWDMVLVDIWEGENLESQNALIENFKLTRKLLFLDLFNFLYSFIEFNKPCELFSWDRNELLGSGIMMILANLNVYRKILRAIISLKASPILWGFLPRVRSFTWDLNVCIFQPFLGFVDFIVLSRRGICWITVFCLGCFRPDFWSRFSNVFL